MKILVVTPTYSPAYRYGGPIQSVHGLNKWLVKKGVEVTVYTTNFDGVNRLANTPTNKEVELDGVKNFYFPVFFRPWFYSRDMHKALAENVGKFDILYLTPSFLSVSALGAYYAKKFKKPYIISPRGNLMVEPLKKKFLKKKIYISLFEKNILKNASAIHFTTHLEKEEYFKTGLPIKKSIIISNGIDSESLDSKTAPDFFKNKFNIPKNKKIILSLGRLNWKKGFDTLIPAMAKVVKKRPESLLIIAGNDNDGYKKVIDNLITKQKLQKNVIYTGMVLGDDKIAAFKNSDIFVLPSYSENFGMAAAEALYFGLPSVLTKAVAISYDIKKANAGIVIDKNSDQLADAIIKIIDSPDLGRKFGENGKKLVKERFSFKSIAEQFIKEIGNIIGGETKKIAEKISVGVIILTFNEELNIENCLKSVVNWADEVFIVDSFSTDKTLEIAKKYGCKIFQHKFENQAQQFNWALDNLKIKNEWIFRLDADEYLTEELKQEIIEKLPETRAEVSGFYIKRRVYFMGHWIRYGGYYPSEFLRLFRKGNARSEERKMDEHIVLLEGIWKRLKNDFVDDNKKDLTWWINKHNNFSSREAEEVMNRRMGGVKIRIFGDPAERKRWFKDNFYLKLPLFFRAFAYFMYRYFFRFGFLDGKKGLIFHFLQAFWYRFLVDAKIYEKQKILK